MATTYREINYWTKEEKVWTVPEGKAKVEPEPEVKKPECNTIEEIKARINQLEGAIFYESMADFMNWANYYKLEAELKELKKKLENMEAGK